MRNADIHYSDIPPLDKRFAFRIRPQAAFVRALTTLEGVIYTYPNNKSL
jgi:hypothetical protein